MATEVFFASEDLIVSRTNTRGIIQYANDAFLRISGFDVEELLGRPHSIIRHPDMPRSVFQILWSTIQRGEEVFAFVKNQCKNGDYYWVLAYVTPDRDPQTGEISGYFSVRRVANRNAIAQVEGLYHQLWKIESKHASKMKGIEASIASLQQFLDERGLSYVQMVYALQQGKIV
jgi:PAS domain S-box-containing protein